MTHAHDHPDPDSLTSHRLPAAVVGVSGKPLLLGRCDATSSPASAPVSEASPEPELPALLVTVAERELDCSLRPLSAGGVLPRQETLRCSICSKLDNGFCVMPVSCDSINRPTPPESQEIITVRRPHSQRMSSAANAPPWNIRDRKQCKHLS